MKKHLLLLIFPAISLFLFVSGYWLFSDWIKLAISGETADARIEAILFDRDQSEQNSSLLYRLEHEIVMTRASGDLLKLTALNNQITAITEDGRALDLSEGLIAAVGGNEVFANDLQQLVSSAKDRTQWFMLRQSRIEDDTRFVRLEKVEFAYLANGPTESLALFELDENDVVRPTSAGDGISMQTVTTQAIFSSEDVEALAERKGDFMEGFTIFLDEKPMEENKREFYIFNDPYSTIQYPIFVFEHQDSKYAILSDLGKHGDPFLAFPYYADAGALFYEDQPTKAILIGEIVAPEPGEKYLNWFSKISEIVMTRWIYPGMFFICALLAMLVGGIFASFLLFPVKKLPPVPEDDKTEEVAEK